MTEDNKEAYEKALEKVRLLGNGVEKFQSTYQKQVWQLVGEMGTSPIREGETFEKFRKTHLVLVFALMGHFDDIMELQKEMMEDGFKKKWDSTN